MAEGTTRTPGPGWHKIEDDGSVHITCPRCGWWIKLTPMQALGKEIIECGRCHQYADYFTYGGDRKNPDFEYAPLPQRQHRDRSGFPR